MEKYINSYNIVITMELELIRPIIRVGNSSGVLLPKEWLNGKAQVKLIKKPINIKQEILQILEPYLEDVLGIYLVGSYARGEEDDKSDVDILVITEKENKRIVHGKYEIILVAKQDLEKTLKKNILPLLPMLKEAKPILNGKLIENYLEILLTRKNLKFYIDITKSAMKMNKIAIEIKEMQNKNISDNIMYSLILNLRQTYIVDCLIKNKKQSKKDLLKLIREITGSERAYEAYVRSKNQEKTRKEINIQESKKIYTYILKKVKEHEKWIKKRV
jgi:predicted nucleotidyltransferase